MSQPRRYNMFATIFLVALNTFLVFITGGWWLIALIVWLIIWLVRK